MIDPEFITPTQLPQRISQARAIALPNLHDGLRRYLAEIAKFPMLSHSEELELSRRFRDSNDIAAAHRLVTSHLRLVAKIAFKFRGYGLPAGELISEGNIGLMQAVKRYDPEKGFRLSTYAMWWIRAAIQEYILRSWSLVKIGTSAAQKRLFFNLRKLKKKLGVDTPRAMDEDVAVDIARRLEVSKEEVIDMDQRMNAADVYLNSAIGPEGDGEKMDLLMDERDNQEQMLANFEEKSQQQTALATAMKVLNDREKAILVARRLQDEPETLEELSKLHNISRERVRQIEVRAFEKLQEAMLGGDMKSIIKAKAA